MSLVLLDSSELPGTVANGTPPAGPAGGTKLPLLVPSMPTPPAGPDGGRTLPPRVPSTPTPA
ncbi:MAG: hypothetical protein ACOCVZ_06550, partial [Gemmatimonadota bacterium]